MLSLYEMERLHTMLNKQRMMVLANYWYHIFMTTHTVESEFYYLYFYRLT